MGENFAIIPVVSIIWIHSDANPACDAGTGAFQLD